MGRASPRTALVVGAALITRRYRLAELNEGYRDLLEGRNIRGVVMHEH